MRILISLQATFKYGLTLILYRHHCHLDKWSFSGWIKVPAGLQICGAMNNAKCVPCCRVYYITHSILTNPLRTAWLQITCKHCSRVQAFIKPKVENTNMSLSFLLGEEECVNKKWEKGQAALWLCSLEYSVSAAKTFLGWDIQQQGQWRD